jgi:hypothetical protein
MVHLARIRYWINAPTMLALTRRRRGESSRKRNIMVRMQPKELEFIRVEEQALFGSLELEDMKKAVDGQHRLAVDRVESLLPVQGEKVDM